MRIMRCERVIFGCSSSPFLLNATIKHHLNNYDQSRVVAEVKDNMYMDDLLTGANDTDQACKMIDAASKIMSDASMHLTKWRSNSEIVKEKLMMEFKDVTEQAGVMKILGLKWDSLSDHFEFSVSAVSPNVVVTKRLVLSLLSRVFDPLGFLTPYTIVAKILFQKLWKLGAEWDEEVTCDISSDFISWIKGLTQLQEFKVPRCFVTQSWTTSNRVELHAFSDASVEAYCAVVYVGSECLKMMVHKE